VVICLERGADDLHMVQLMSLPAHHLLLYYRTHCFGAVSLCFLFVYEISREPLNVSVPNSHGRRVYSLARTSLKVNVKGQGHHG